MKYSKKYLVPLSVIPVLFWCFFLSGLIFSDMLIGELLVLIYFIGFAIMVTYILFLLIQDLRMSNIKLASDMTDYFPRYIALKESEEQINGKMADRKNITHANSTFISSKEIYFELISVFVTILLFVAMIFVSRNNTWYALVIYAVFLMGIFFSFVRVILRLSKGNKFLYYVDDQSVNIVLNKRKRKLLVNDIDIIWVEPNKFNNTYTVYFNFKGTAVERWNRFLQLYGFGYIGEPIFALYQLENLEYLFDCLEGNLKENVKIINGDISDVIKYF